MAYSSNVSRRYKRQWLVGSNGKWLLIALLVFAFPVGLYIMWDESKWKLWIKIAVSVLWAAVIITAILLVGKWLLIALLILAFPVGLYFMWAKTKWKLWIKIVVTALYVTHILLCILLAPLSILANLTLWQSINDMSKSIIYHEVDYENEMLAPLPPENVPDTSQHTRSSRDESGLISEPTPTPKPTMVYCNDNGQYYHLAGCRYVYEGKTPKVTLTQAKNAGKTACPYCNPPKEETYND